MRKVLLTALFIAMCTMAMAKKNLRDKIDFTQKYFDITWAFPEDFKAEEWYRGEEIYSTMVPSKGGSGAGNVYWMGAMSADRNCRLLYQSTMILASTMAPEKNTVFSTFVEHELYCAVNGRDTQGHNKAKMKPEWNKYLTIMSGEEALTAHNADSVYVVDFPNVSERFATGYNHCIGFYMVKADHLPIILMCLLNDAGYQQKDKYIQAVRQAVRFGDRKSVYNKKASKAFNKIQSKDRKWMYSE